MPDGDPTMPDDPPVTVPDGDPVVVEEDPAIAEPPDHGIDLTPHRGRKRVAAIAVITAAVVAATAVGVSRSPIVHARTIRVHGAAHLSRADVLRMAQIAVGVNVFMLDAGAAERRLEADPWVERAVISKHLPSTLVWTCRAIPGRGHESTGLLRLVAGDGTLLDAAGPSLAAADHRPRRRWSPPRRRSTPLRPSSMPVVVRRQVAQVTVFADGAACGSPRRCSGQLRGGIWWPRHRRAALCVGRRRRGRHRLGGRRSVRAGPLG
jgi:hypothetical protein